MELVRTCCPPTSRRARGGDARGAGYALRPRSGPSRGTRKEYLLVSWERSTRAVHRICRAAWCGPASPACACHPRVAYASRHTPHARGPTAETSLDVSCLTCGMRLILESIADKRTTPGGDRLRCPNYPARTAVSVTLLSPRSNGSDLSLDFRPGRISKLHQR